MSALSQFRDATTTFLNMFGDWFESKAPIEDRFDTLHDKENAQLNKAVASGIKVGAAAERIVQNLAIAQALQKKQRAAIEAHVRQAQIAESKGDVEKAAEHNKTGSMLAVQLKETEARIATLDSMAVEATNNQEDINKELQRQARKLAQKFEDDQMTALEYRMAEGRSEMLELQKMVYHALPGDSDNMRNRIEEEVQERIAETSAASKLWGKIWEDKKMLADTEDMVITIEGEAAYKEIAASLGYQPKALPAPSEGAATH